MYCRSNYTCSKFLYSVSRAVARLKATVSRVCAEWTTSAAVFWTSDVQIGRLSGVSKLFSISRVLSLSLSSSLTSGKEYRGGKKWKFNFAALTREREREKERERGGNLRTPSWALNGRIRISTLMNINCWETWIRL